MTLQATVADGEAGVRLDCFLAAQLAGNAGAHAPPHTRSQIKKYLDAGFCRVNGQPARPATKLQVGDRVEYAPPPPEPSEVEPEEIPLAVLFEDDDLVVIDKPAGMVVHPAPGHARGTLVGALLGHCEGLSGVGGVQRPGIVHRLDKLTSGVMVASKSDAAHLGLAAQFKQHTIERRYRAIVTGHLASAQGTFDTHHQRHPTDRKRFTTRTSRSDGSGRRAVTHYRVVERLYGASLVEARLETGRTHQVRVHFAEHGHAVVGDPVYGRPAGDALVRAVAARLGRQALHAEVLGFAHPVTGEPLRFVSPLPPDMQHALETLRRGSP